jgi:class 3 adenylate cyclase
MLVNFEGLNNFRNSMGLVNFVVFPLRVDKLIRYFIGISWDEYAISRVYLARVFASLNNSREHLLKARTSLFDLLDPITYIPRTPAFIQAYGNLRNEMLFSGESESARMGMLLKAGMRSRRTVKLKVDGDEEAIYYVLPGRFFTLYVVGGIQPTTFLKKIEEWRALILLLGTVFFTVCAAVAAQNVSRSVSSPLEHLLWGLSMIERSDFNVRLRDTREDEFGSISRAFNLMARRLRERDMLGKFVSPEVRRLAGDHELFQAARQGSEADVTILFAALEGFDEYAVTAPVEKVQALLENTLEQFYRLAGETGGEVDKIIGGKLLIVFSHSRVGSKQAAASAVYLASRILKIFKDDARVRLVFGINSGRVISGIIGAPAVRMDNTVIGDPVNVAARLCSLADSQKMPVVVSEQVVAALDGRYPASRVEIRSIRGKKQEVEVFNLLINEAD